MTVNEAFKTLKENICQQCAYGAHCMDECDIRSCDNRDAIKVLMTATTMHPIEKDEDGAYLLPGYYETVLVQVRGNGDPYIIACYLRHNSTWRRDEFIEDTGEGVYHCYTIDEIEAWMPMPELYKEAGDEMDH